MDPAGVIVRLSPAVARALDALALPGEERSETIARLAWAAGTSKLREQSKLDEEYGPAGGFYARYVKDSKERKP